MLPGSQNLANAHYSFPIARFTVATGFQCETIIWMNVNRLLIHASEGRAGNFARKPPLCPDGEGPGVLLRSPQRPNSESSLHLGMCGRGLVRSGRRVLKTVA
jgi:hypothetical protein